MGQRTDCPKVTKIGTLTAFEGESDFLERGCRKAVDRGPATYAPTHGLSEGTTVPTPAPGCVEVAVTRSRVEVAVEDHDRARRRGPHRAALRGGVPMLRHPRVGAPTRVRALGLASIKWGSPRSAVRPPACPPKPRAKAETRLRGAAMSMQPIHRTYSGRTCR